jgi:hypothetical protein
LFPTGANFGLKAVRARVENERAAASMQGRKFRPSVVCTRSAAHRHENPGFREILEIIKKEPFLYCIENYATRTKWLRLRLAEYQCSYRGGWTSAMGALKKLVEEKRIWGVQRASRQHAFGKLLNLYEFIWLLYRCSNHSPCAN